MVVLVCVESCVPVRNLARYEMGGSANRFISSSTVQQSLFQRSLTNYWCSRFCSITRSFWANFFKVNECNKTRIFSDGAGRTGVFCSLINLIQRLKCENKIDVFRTVKDLRDCRPCMVRTAVRSILQDFILIAFAFLDAKKKKPSQFLPEGL